MTYCCRLPVYCRTIWSVKSKKIKLQIMLIQYSTVHFILVRLYNYLNDRPQTVKAEIINNTFSLAFTLKFCSNKLNINSELNNISYWILTSRIFFFFCSSLRANFSFWSGWTLTPDMMDADYEYAERRGNVCVKSDTENLHVQKEKHTPCSGLFVKIKMLLLKIYKNQQFTVYSRAVWVLDSDWSEGCQGCTVLYKYRCLHCKTLSLLW